MTCYAILMSDGRLVSKTKSREGTQHRLREVVNLVQRKRAKGAPVYSEPVALVTISERRPASFEDAKRATLCVLKPRGPLNPLEVRDLLVATFGARNVHALSPLQRPAYLRALKRLAEEKQP